jgi:hypothetical protein
LLPLAAYGKDSFSERNDPFAMTEIDKAIWWAGVKVFALGMALVGTFYLTAIYICYKYGYCF